MVRTITAIIAALFWVLASGAQAWENVIIQPGTILCADQASVQRQLNIQDGVAKGCHKQRVASEVAVIRRVAIPIDSNRGEQIVVEQHRRRWFTIPGTIAAIPSAPRQSRQRAVAQSKMIVAGTGSIFCGNKNSAHYQRHSDKLMQGCTMIDSPMRLTRVMIYPDGMRQYHSRNHRVYSYENLIR